MKGKTGFFKTLRGGLFFKYFLSFFLVFSVPLLLTLWCGIKKVDSLFSRIS